MWFWKSDIEELRLRVLGLERLLDDHLRPPEELVNIITMKNGEKIEVARSGGTVDIGTDGYCYITTQNGPDTTTSIYPKSDILSISWTWRKI